MGPNSHQLPNVGTSPRGVLSLTRVPPDRDDAGVPGPSLRRGADQNLPGRPLAAAVRLHQDIGTTLHPTPRRLRRPRRLTGVLCLRRQTDLYSGALFIQVCLGWNIYLSTVLMLVVTALYTIAGARHAHLPLAKYWDLH